MTGEAENNKRIKVLLIRPPQVYFDESCLFSLSFPVGLAQIAAVLEGCGCRVEILDMQAYRFAVEKRFGFSRLGIPLKCLKEEISARSPDIVGITCPFTSQMENAVKAADSIKAVDKSIIIVVGGAHVSVCAKEFLSANQSFDIGIIGEGEEAFLDLIKNFDIKNKSISCLGQIKGIAFRGGQDIVVNPARGYIQDLDTLPLPAYHLFDMKNYLSGCRGVPRSREISKGYREISIVTSRGCPFQCTFCSIHSHMGRKWRGNSVKYVLEHIRYLIDEYRVNFLHFEDDNFIFDRSRIGIFDGFIANNFKIKWDTPNGVRADTLNRALMERIKLSGCDSLTIGVESGDQEVLDKIIMKNLSLSKVIDVAGAAKEIGLRLKAFFMLGFPGEKIENMKKTFEFGKLLSVKYNVEWSFSIATPLPGTELYNICLNNKYFSREVNPAALASSTAETHTSLIRTPDFTPGDIAGIIKLKQVFMIKYYFVKYLKSPALGIRELFLRGRLARFVKKFAMIILGKQHGAR